ncbi:MAG: hypothetical protein LBS25_01865 [Candidatus Symbiothrix sp.]|jgi:hypothetical protein|nr:hypothetical protein [Candidatus Symbiothrix sp.]
MIRFQFSLLPILTIIVTTIQAQESKFSYRGFSGGMLVHTGYVQSQSFALFNSKGQIVDNRKLNGMPMGIGGAARLHFGEHLRIGSEGYISTLDYSNKSYASIGWGGVLADGIWTIGRFSPFIGATLGGGSMKHITMLQQPATDFVLENENISYRRYGFLALVPFIGTEYALNKKIHLVLKADHIFNLNNPQADFLRGIRIYLGFAFCR